MDSKQIEAYLDRVPNLATPLWHCSMEWLETGLLFM